MKNSTKILNIVSTLLLINLVTATTTTLFEDSPEGQEIFKLVKGLQDVAAALGVLMIAYSGARWIMADSPQDREDAKKTIIYVIIGLLIVSLTKDIVKAIYCQTLQSTSYGAGVC